MNRKAVTLDKSSYVRPAQRWGFSCWNIIVVEEEGEWLQCNSWLRGLYIPCNGKLVSISFESWIFWKLTRPKYLFNGGFQYGDGGMTMWSLNIQNFSPHYEKCKTVLFSETVIMFFSSARVILGGPKTRARTNLPNQDSFPPCCTCFLRDFCNLVAPSWQNIFLLEKYPSLWSRGCSLSPKIAECTIVQKARKLNSLGWNVNWA